MLPFKKPVHRQQTIFFRRPSLGIQLIYFSPTACQLPITDTDWDARSRIWECVVSNFKSEIDRPDRVSAIGHKSYYLSLLPHCTLTTCASIIVSAPAAYLQPESNWIFPWGSNTDWEFSLSLRLFSAVPELWAFRNKRSFGRHRDYYTPCAEQIILDKLRKLAILIHNNLN